jgi:tRNA nucleotidyltransferase (CCA-adding enzyme)
MSTDKFEQAMPILEKIEEHEHEAYFVGGCVRDLLLERPIKDIDITTSARPEEIQEIFSSVIPVGIEHGTVIVRHEKESYEVTTFRTEGAYTDSRHPDHVEFIRNIDEDLERRDFTINALAMDKNYRIIDLFQGRKDLDKRIIRTVGDGYERFGEDALRIIRALRFSSQLGFQIDEETFEAMYACKDAILHISVERITHEMEQFFSGKHINTGIHYLKRSEIETVLPIFKDHPNLIEKLPDTMIPLLSFSEVIAYFHYVAPELSVRDWTMRWKCSNRTKNRALKLVDHLRYYENNELDNVLAYHLDTSDFPAFIRLVQLVFDQHLSLTTLDERKESLPIQSREELAIDGNDLMALFPNRKSGPWIRDMISQAEIAVITGELKNENDVIKEWLVWGQTETN